MPRSIWQWTSCRAVVALLVALVLAGAAFAEHGDPRWVFLVELGILFGTVLTGLSTEPFVGGLAGLAGGAGLIATERVAGTWNAVNFYEHAGQVLLLLVVGVCSGLGTTVLRDAWRDRIGEGTAAAPGLLGLLPASLGEARFEEEVERAQYAHDALAVVRLRLDTLDPQWDLALSRVVVRALESTLRVFDVPYAVATNDLLIIMPETDAVEARVTTLRVLRALRAATFAARPSGARMPFREYACVHHAIATFPEDGETAAALLASTAATVEQLRFNRGYADVAPSGAVAITAPDATDAARSRDPAGLDHAPVVGTLAGKSPAGLVAVED
ncbi:hypothetical protein BH23CHL5_BH23CHL5_06010 [soil metagenome]